MIDFLYAAMGKDNIHEAVWNQYLKENSDPEYPHYWRGFCRWLENKFGARMRVDDDRRYFLEFKDEAELIIFKLRFGV